MTGGGIGAFCAELGAGISAEMRRWMKSGMPLRIQVGGEGGIERRLKGGESWTEIVTLGFLVRRALGEVAAFGELENHSAVSLRFSLSQALGTAALLSEQIRESGGTCRRTLPFDGAEFSAKRPGDLLADLEAVKEIRKDLARTLKAALLASPRRGEPGAKARWIEFVPLAEFIRVNWRNRRNLVVHTEELSGFLRRRCRGTLEEVGPRIENGSAVLRRRLEQSDEELRRVSPRLFAAVESYRADPVPLCLRLLLGEHRGVPMDAWLCVHPNLTGDGDCSLRVRRPHRSFVLENDRHRLFYFPSCLLVATLQFRPDIVNLRPPQALVPRGGFAFEAHPYTGTLSLDPFSGARVDPLEDLEILPDVSSEEIRYFPGLERRAVEPLLRDLCLDGQSSFLQSLAAELCDGLTGGRGLDVLGCVTRLHEFVRIGLTRGHQGNLDRPRVMLKEGEMNYPLKGRAVPPSLTARVFRFSPGRNVSPRGVANV